MPTPISSPVYTLGDGWMGNVRDDHGVEWVVESEEGWSSSPPVRAIVEEKANGDGAWSGPGLYGPRVITLSGRALAPNRYAMLAAKDRLKAAIGVRQPETLIVEEAHLTRYAMVRLADRIDIADFGAHAFAWSLTVVAADPRRYGVDVLTGSAELPVDVAVGRTYSKTYDYIYEATPPGTSGSVWLFNAGDFDRTPAVITFLGPVISPRVEHAALGRHLQFDMTVEWGQTLVVDLGAQTAMLNGTSSRIYTISPGSAWFMLTPGWNELLFRGTAGSAPPGEDPKPLMVVTAAPAWT